MNSRTAILALCSVVCFAFRVSAAPADPPAEPTVVRLWFGLSGPIGQAIQAQAERFNRSHPNIRVEVTLYNGYGDTLTRFRAAQAAGDPPEIAVVEIHGVVTMAARGEIASLETLASGDKEFAADDLLPAVLKNVRWKDQLYAVPFNRSTPILYYNKTRFKAAGLDPDKPPRTWNELREAARKLTTDPEKSYGFAATASWWFFEALAFGNGGELVSADGKAKFAAAGAPPLQLWADMIHRDKTARPGGGNEFYRGEAAMYLESTALLSFWEDNIKDFEIGTAPVPHTEGQKPGVPTGGGAAVIAAKLSPEKQRAAWQVLSWLTATEQTADSSRRTGYVPLRKSAVELLTKEGFYRDHPNYLTAVQQLDHAREFPVVPYWGAALAPIGTAMRKCLENNEPAEISLAQAAVEVSNILARNNAPKKK